MTVYIGADHGGFAMKGQLVELLRSNGYEVVDVGADIYDPADDYPIFGKAVADRVVADPGSRGIALCRSGHGMVIAANKVRGARAMLATEDTAWTTQAVENDDANILTIGVDYIDNRVIWPVVQKWLEAKYAGGRHQRRVDQITAMEKPTL